MMSEDSPGTMPTMQQDEMPSSPTDAMSAIPVEAMPHVSQNNACIIEPNTVSSMSQDSMPSLIEEVVSSVPEDTEPARCLSPMESTVVFSTTLNDNAQSTPELVISDVKSHASVCDDDDADESFKNQIIIIKSSEKQVACVEDSAGDGNKQIVFDVNEASLYDEHRGDGEHVQVISVDEHCDTVDFETNPDGSVKRVEIMAVNKPDEHTSVVYEAQPPGGGTEQVNSTVL